jgi:hypothetical protein
VHVRTRRRLHTIALVVALAGAGASHAAAKGKPAPKPRKAPATAAASSASEPRPNDEATAETTPDAAEAGKPGKPKVYNFSGLDLEGRLKTPQLLYFLNRVRVELDSTNNAKRSFMKELERSADDKGL